MNACATDLEDGGEAAVLDDILVATRTSDVPCSRRKPAPGMLLEALESFGRGAEAATMVGDTVTDMQAAAAAGVADRILVGTGYGAGILEAAHRATRDEVGTTTTTTRSTKCTTTPITPLRIASPEDDPSGSLPPECLPLVLCANLGEAVDFMLNRPPA